MMDEVLDGALTVASEGAENTQEAVTVPGEGCPLSSAGTPEPACHS